MRTLPGFGRSIARRSLDEVPSSSDTMQQPFHPMIVRSDDLELVHQCAGLQIGAHTTLGRGRFFRVDFARQEILFVGSIHHGGVEKKCELLACRTHVKKSLIELSIWMEAALKEERHIFDGRAPKAVAK